MKQIDESRLETDTAYRYEYMTEFIGFGDEDISAIRALTPSIAPKFPAMVDATYEQLLSFDATARHFVARQHGYTGPVPQSIEDLSQNQEQIQFRKEHLTRYFMHLMGQAYKEKTATYLDMVGKMHTPKAGSKAIDVPQVQMNALMGLLSDILMETIFGLDIDRETALRGYRAFNKLLWIQNDFITRHYGPS